MVARASVVAALAALLVAGTALADAEKQISSDSASGLMARRGWVSWSRDAHDGERALWRGGALSTFPSVPSVRALGTDGRRRTEVLYATCGDGGCRVRAHRLADGSDRPLISTPRRVVGIAERRGTVAYTSSGYDDLVGGDGAGLFLRPRGVKRFRRVAGGGAGQVALGNGWVVVRSYDVKSDYIRITAFDFRGHKRVLAVDDQFDDECRCTTSSTNESDPQAEGRFAYWLERSAESTNGSYAGGPYQVVNRVLRVDLESRAPIVAEFLPAHEVSPYASFAVDRGSVFYAALGDAVGVFRVADPGWRQAQDTLPVRG
jgi:hypothetical protein